MTDIPKKQDFRVLFDGHVAGRAARAGDIVGLTDNAARYENVQPAQLAVPVAPLVMTQPSISGGTTTGSVLTLAQGVASGTPAPTAAIQWLRSGTAISGAMSDSYTLVAADEGKAITARVSWTNGAGTAVGTSNAVTGTAPAPTAVAPTVTTQPSISGSTTTGSVLTLAQGAASGTPAPVAAVQWLRAGTAISGAAGTTYTLVAADEGKAITAKVTWTNSAGNAVGTSNAITGVAPAATAIAPAVTTQPSISGNTTTGSVLTLAQGAASGTPAPTAAIQWLRAGTAITGATGGTYTLVAADEGLAITAKVTWTNSAGTATGTSNAITGSAAASTTVAPAVTTQPSISGNTATGSVLTLTEGAASGTPAPSGTVQWLRAGSVISGATAATYTLVAADEGQAITAKVTWTNSAGTATGTSNAITGTAAAVERPSKPGNLVYDESRTLMSWSASTTNGPDAIIGYEIGGSHGISPNPVVTGTSFSLANLAPKAYSLRVRAVTANTSIVSTWTDYIAANVPAPAAIDYNTKAIAYYAKGMPIEGTDAAVTSVQLAGTAAIKMGVVGTGTDVTNSAAGLATSAGKYLSKSGLSGLPMGDGVFAIAKVTLNKAPASGTQDILSGTGKYVRILSLSPGTSAIVQAVADSNVNSDNIPLTYPATLVIGGIMDDVSDTLRVLNPDGSIQAAKPVAITDPAVSVFNFMKNVDGTLERLVIVGRPEGGAWPLEFEKVAADFRGA